jgi:exonuclease III
LREVETHGGGVAIGISSKLIFRDQSDKIPETLQELEMIMAQVTCEQFEIYVVNVYCSNSNTKRKYIRPFSEWLVELQARKPKAVFVVCGDFNQDKNPLPHMHTVNKEEITFRRKHLNGLRQSRTDWVLVSKRIENSCRYSWNDLSDHALIACSLHIPNARPQASHILIPNRLIIQMIN